MNVLRRLDALCIRGLLRCLGGGPRGPAVPATIRLGREDIDALRFWWALSGSVGRLAERTKTRPREIAGTIGAEEKIAAGEIPGILDACETARIQARTGDPSLFAVMEPSPTWISGPNRLLAITLLEAERSIVAAERAMSTGIFHTIIPERAKLLEDALRVSALREILMSPMGRSRLTPHERRQAGKARAPIYRLANDAAEALRGVEALNPETLAVLFSESLLPALDTWRRFELATVLGCVEALTRALGHPATLDASFSAYRPVARVGDFSVWWQKTVPTRPFAALDTGERMARDLALFLGAKEGSGRADATVERNGRIVALIECKWFADANSAPGAILDACEQLVRYARDDAHWTGRQPSDLLGRSLIALADRGSAPLVVDSGLVGCVDIKDIEDDHLDAWATRVAAAT